MVLIETAILNFFLALLLLENGFPEHSFLFIERIFSKENYTVENCTWSNPSTILVVYLFSTSFQNKISKEHMHISLPILC